MTALIPSELPKSLQAMIADAKTAIANWDPNEDADDHILQGVRDWTLRLSQGEYDDNMYWECVAEDCEENGDWEGAITAYRRILDPQPSGFDHWKACLDIAFIYNLLGDSKAALRYYQRAHPAGLASTTTYRLCARCLPLQTRTTGTKNTRRRQRFAPKPREFEPTGGFR